MTVNIQRVMERLEALARFTDTPGAGVTRFSYSDKDQAARSYLMDIFSALDMQVRLDAVGNILARMEGDEPSLAPLWVGSHIDSVKNGGAYDGVLGVIGALEAASVLHETGTKPRRPLEVVIFAEEEGSNFGTTMVGSKVMAGKLNIEGLKALHDEAGISCYERLKTRGYDPERLEDCVVKAGQIHAMLELHIEQAIVLENSRKRLGVVQAIAGMTTLRVTVEGESNHAGATPMDMRADPMVAAAEAIVAVERISKAVSPTTVGTVGSVECLPGMPNVIPKTVRFTVDIRDVEQAGIDSACEAVLKTLEEIAASRRVRIAHETIGASRVYKLAQPMRDLIEAAAQRSGQPYLCMNSGAVHDCAMLTGVTDVGMIFIPSCKGNSHNALEYSAPEDIALGCQLLLEAVRELTA